MDIKNTKEVLIAANDVTLELIKLLKDGAQVADAVQLATDLMGPLKDEIIAAFADAKTVVDEVKDIDMSEVFDLVKMQIDYSEKIIAALKA